MPNGLKIKPHFWRNVFKLIDWIDGDDEELLLGAFIRKAVVRDMPVFGLEEDFLVDVFGSHRIFVSGFHVEHNVELLLPAGVRRVDIFVLGEVKVGWGGIRGRG